MEKETSSSQRTASTEENGHNKDADYLDLQHQNSNDDTNLQRPEKRSIWHRLNPFHTSTIPPVPATDAGLVPEVGANFLSKLTWGWMGSLMMVSRPPSTFAFDSH